MRKLFAVILLAVLAIQASWAQDAIVDIDEVVAMSKADATLGQKAVAVFLSKGNNIVVSSSNHSDVIGTTRSSGDGQYATEVTCDLSDASIDRSRTFSVLIKGTSLKGNKKKTMQAGRRYYFQVTEAEHVLTPWWPDTKNVLYAKEGKAALEFNIPLALDNLQVRFSDGIGGNVIRKTDKGMNIVTLEVDCASLQALLAEIARTTKDAAAAEARLEQLKADNNAKCNLEGFDFDAAEAAEQKLEEEAEKARESIPHLFVTLAGENTNELSIPQEKIEMLTQPKYKLTMGVNDALQKTIVGTTALAEKMKSANMAYQGRRFKEAKAFYEQAAQDNDATEADKAACEGWVETINKCIEAQTEANKALALLKSYKDKGGQVNPDDMVELFNIAIANYRTLYSITKNEFYETRIESCEKSRDKIGYVMSGTVISTNFKQGILHEEPITGIDIYGVKGSFTKDMRKGSHGTFVGRVEADGKFHVEVPRDAYDGLLFVPSGNKKFDDNVWQSLKGTKHLDIQVKFSRDH